MANPDAGKCDCPVCGAAGAAVRVNKKQRAYIHCEGCMVQIQARGPVSDRAIRGRVRDVEGGDVVGDSGGVREERAEAPSGARPVRAGAVAGRVEQSTAEAVPPPKKPAQPKASAVVHTVEGASVAGVAPEVPEFNLIDGLMGLLKA